MYKEKDIREILENGIENKENFSISNTMQIIKEFVKKFNNDEAFRCVFCIDEFDEACAKKGIWTISPTEYYADTVDVEKSFSVLEEFLNGNILTTEEKRSFALAFIESFIENSDNESGCEHRVYIIVENLDGRGDDFVKEFNDYDDAVSEVENIYESMLDDEVLAENVWFPILCQLQNYEYDELKNFSTIIKIDASDLEDLRKNEDDE